MPSKVGMSYCDEAGLIMFVGHKYLYERGVLHRDISPGNILIKWRPGSKADEPSVSGCLIDLDHAKKAKLAQNRAKPQAPADDTIIDRVRDMFHGTTGIAVENEVARLSLEFFPMMQNSILSTLMYLGAAHAHTSRFRNLNGQLCTPQHLRWKSVRLHLSPFPSP